MKTIEPFADRILVVPIIPIKTKFGLSIPPSAQKKSNQSIVVAIGPDTHDIEVGDTIIHDASVGVAMEVEGDNYLLMRQPDVLGVVDGSGIRPM